MDEWCLTPGSGFGPGSTPGNNNRAGEHGSPNTVRSRTPLIVASAILIIRMLITIQSLGEINYCSWNGAYMWLKKRRQNEGDGVGATVALVPIS
jgi:hypothetical protein